MKRVLLSAALLGGLWSSPAAACDRVVSFFAPAVAVPLTIEGAYGAQGVLAAPLVVVQPHAAPARVRVFAPRPRLRVFVR